MTAALDSSMSSISSGSSFSSGICSGTKKSVSFPDNVVSEIHSVEKNDQAMKGELFYSQQDFRRFKEERRLTRIKSQRMACRSKSRRRGIMYETVMPTATTKALFEHHAPFEVLISRTNDHIEHRISRMNLIMEIDNEARPELREGF